MDNKPNFNLFAPNLFYRIWRGGNFNHFWTKGSNGRRRKSYWFSLNQRIPKPPNEPVCTYYGVHPVLAIPQTNAKGKAAPPESLRSQIKYIQCINCLFAEFDFKDFGGSEEATIQHIQSIPVKPSIGIFSGGGYHLIWLLDRTAYISTEADREYLQAVQYHWVDYVGGDSGAKDLARVLRVVGSVNYKPCYAPNFPTVTMVKMKLNLTYDLDVLAMACRPETHPQTPAKTTQALPLNGTAADFIQQKKQTAIRMIQAAEDGKKHDMLLAAAILVGGVVQPGGIKEEEARELLREAIQTKPTVKNMDDAFDTIDDGLSYGKERPFTLPPS